MLGGRKKQQTPVGTSLGGRYEVRCTLGSGGMATVYGAEDSILGRPVALKVLHDRYAREESFRRRFKQEARAMASLDHKNVVKIYDISHDLSGDGEVPFIVAEWVLGRDLGRMLSEIRGGRLEEPFARRVAAQLLEGLSYAHQQGVVHRDIKPSNILVTPEGDAKVADFGIARLAEEDEAGEPGEIIGSARYMAPEQLKGEPATARSDLYSVGILIYHCMAGRPPFSGDLKDLARRQIHDEPTPPRKLNKKMSPHLEEVILKALSKDPDDRYPSADAMLEELDAEPFVKMMAGRRRPGRPPNEVREPRQPRRKRGRAARTMLLAATFSVLLLVLAGGSLAADRFGFVDLPELGAVEEFGNASEAEGAGAVRPVEPVRDAPPEPPAVESDAAEEAEEPPADIVRVPNVHTYYDYWAAENLERRGFDVRIVYQYRDGYQNRGVTWATDPAIGSMAPEGSTVTVFATPKDQPQRINPP